MNLVIFDCDGVLIESEALLNQYEFEVLKNLGLPISFEEYLNVSVGRQHAYVAEILKTQFSFDTSEEVWQNLRDHQKDVLFHELTAIDGVDAAIQAIDLPKCIASSSSVERLHHTLKITGLIHYFSGCIFSTEYVKRPKPHPDIYFYAAEKMQTSPSGCVVIEDSIVGIQGALAAGMTVFAFGGGKHITASAKVTLKQSGAHEYFEHMSALPELLGRIAC